MIKLCIYIRRGYHNQDGIEGHEVRLRIMIIFRLDFLQSVLNDSYICTRKKENLWHKASQFK